MVNAKRDCTVFVIAGFVVPTEHAMLSAKTYSVHVF